jgi:hypothetical protein
VERYVHAPIHTVAVRPAAHPEQRYDNAHLHLYKPTIAPVERTAPQPAPSRPAEIRDVPRINERPAPQPARQQYSAPRQQRAPQPRSAPSGGGYRGGGGGNPKR